jgi:hypothetical protein
MAGLDPAIHQSSQEAFSSKQMDCRVKPGNDVYRTHILASLRGAQRRSNPYLLCCGMDCFASLAMTVSEFCAQAV